MSKLNVVSVRNGYNYDRRAASVECGLRCEEPSLTQQHFADECDINHILKQFAVTGILPENPLPPRYGDFSGISDYQTALQAVSAAEEAFMALPANIRARFGHNPAELINFIADDANRQEAIALGLLAAPDKAPAAPVASPPEPSEGAEAP